MHALRTYHVEDIIPGVPVIVFELAHVFAIDYHATTHGNFKSAHVWQILCLPTGTGLLVKQPQH